MLPTITYCAPSARPVTRRRNDLGSELDRVLDGLFGAARGSGLATCARGSADLYETDAELVLELEVPGFSKEEIEVTVERGVLTVDGSRAHDAKDTEATDNAEEAEEGGDSHDNATYHIRERSFESFTRTFRVPESVGSEEILAELEAGVLTVRLPKAAEAKPRRIEISVK
jgi:HSP20 family protein